MVWNLFSKRRKAERGEAPDVLVYDSLPQQLRVQIVHIMKDALGEPYFGGGGVGADIYTNIVETLRQERGVFQLIERPKNPQTELFTYFLTEENPEHALDVVELVFRAAEKIVARTHYYVNQTPGVKISPAEAVNRLNTRFREHGVGYHFESGEIIRVDSQLIHKESVLPALNLLRVRGFEEANREFLDAHEHYRRGNFGDAVVNAAKSFESTLKVICAQRGWKVDANATAKPLINAVITGGLIPAYLESQFAGLRGLLESTVTIRNKDAGHGAGVKPSDLPEWYARYAMNLTASTIVFLAEAHRAKQ